MKPSRILTNLSRTSRFPLRARGFTLVEMMITVVIVAILAAIVLPSYGDYITRSRLTEAYGTLTGWQSNAEQYWSDNRTYVGFSVPASANTANFTFAASNLSASTYQITATGTGSMAGFGFTVDQSNTRVTTGVKSGWTMPTVNCWTARKSGECLK